VTGLAEGGDPVRSAGAVEGELGPVPYPAWACGSGWGLAVRALGRAAAGDEGGEQRTGGRRPGAGAGGLDEAAAAGLVERSHALTGAQWAVMHEAYRAVRTTVDSAVATAVEALRAAGGGEVYLEVVWSKGLTAPVDAAAVAELARGLVSAEVYTALTGPWRGSAGQRRGAGAWTRRRTRNRWGGVMALVVCPCRAGSAEAGAVVPAPAPGGRTFLTVPEAAVQLRLDESTLNRHLREGRFPGVKLWGRYLVPAAVIGQLAADAIAAGRCIDVGQWTQRWRQEQAARALAAGYLAGPPVAAVAG